MAFGTIYFIPNIIEPVLWIIIFLFSAYVIAKFCKGRYFLNGFMVSILNGIWIGVIRFIFFDAYLNFHPELASKMTDSSPEAIRYGFLIFQLIFGVLCGLLLGLFSWGASKIVKKKPAPIPSGFSC
jgi:hypothetical protein